MDFEFLKRSFSKICLNSYRVYAGKDLDGKLHRQIYSRGDLDAICQKAYEEGKDEFYADLKNKNDKNSSYIATKPRYEYVMDKHLTQEEYDALMSLINKKED